MPIIRRIRADLDLDKIDWGRLDRTTDSDIDAQIASDEETAPIFTDRELVALTNDP